MSRQHTSEPLIPPPLEVLQQLGMTPDRIRHVQPIPKRTHCRAIINWLTKYRSHPTASNLERVKGYLQAFYRNVESLREGAKAHLL